MQYSETPKHQRVTDEYHEQDIRANGLSQGRRVRSDFCLDVLHGLLKHASIGGSSTTQLSGADLAISDRRQFLRWEFDDRFFFYLLPIYLTFHHSVTAFP